jgi:DNA-binding helix-hairpin-helix protein with protein kinase domain
VVGDLNESNVLVARSTLVTLIDTDSFQVQVPGRAGTPHIHFCEVGKPEYLPPELQSADLRKTVRVPEHDRFALAVLIFQLLMDGNHPFRARWVGAGEKPPFPERIERGLFPYREGAGKYVEPVISIESMHPLLVDLFKRCFILGHESPSARPHVGALQERPLPQPASHPVPGVRASTAARQPAGPG